MKKEKSFLINNRRRRIANLVERWYWNVIAPDAEGDQLSLRLYAAYRACKNLTQYIRHDKPFFYYMWKMRRGKPWERSLSEFVIPRLKNYRILPDPKEDAQLQREADVLAQDLVDLVLQYPKEQPKDN